MGQNRSDSRSVLDLDHSTAMTVSLRHLALVVSDLRAAEQYYQTVFDMALIGREALQKDGEWYTLPFEKGWEDAHAAEIDLGMSALRKGSFVLALFQGEVVYGQVYVIGLEMPAEQIARIRVRLAENTGIIEEAPTSLTFCDPYRITWQISVPGGAFRTAGDFAGRWLQL
jgi:catechol 2,3-dioxygenase-like lactoylglutathione lyase family enzyme